MEFFNYSIERSVLSTFLFEPSRYSEVAHRLSHLDFAHAGYQDIYIAITDLDRSDIPIDEEFVKKILENRKRYNEQALLEVMTAGLLPNISAYIDELLELSRKREIDKFIRSIKMALEDGKSADETMSLLYCTSDKFSDTNQSSFFTIRNAATTPAIEADFIIKNWLPLPLNTVSLISAPGGTGKSWLVLQLACRYLLENPTKKAFLWLSEDPSGITAHRLEKILTAILEISGDKKDSLLSRLDISDDPTPLLIYEENRKIIQNPQFWQMKRILDPYDLIIFDPLIAFFGADENNNSHARRFMQMFSDWAGKMSKTILFIHHSTKNTTQSRGASAFVDAVRLVYEMDKLRTKEGKELASDKRKLILSKDNYGALRHLENNEVERQIFPTSKNLIFPALKPACEKSFNHSDIHDLGVLT